MGSSCLRGYFCHGVLTLWGLFMSWGLHFVMGSSHRGVLTSWESWGLHVLGSSCLGGSLCHGVFTLRSLHIVGSSCRGGLGVFMSWGFFMSWGLHVVEFSFHGVFICGGLHLWGSSYRGVLTSWGLHIMGVLGS